MINLLPLPDKKIIKSAYRHKVLEWYSLLLAGLLVILLVLAGCLYFLITMRAETEQNILSSLQTSDKSNSGTEQITAASINQAISSLTGLAQTPRISDLISILVTQKPAGIKLTSFKFTQSAKDKGKVAIDIQGVAANRQSLLSFSTLLQNTTGFQDVNSPYSNLVKKTNAEFDISWTASAIKPVTTQ